MKKVVLSLAVIAMISFVSCKETAKEETPETTEVEVATEVETPAVEEAPVVEDTVAAPATEVAPEATEEAAH